MSYLILLLIGLNLLLFGILLIKGRADQNNKLMRRWSISLIIVTILVLFSYTFYYEYKLKKEISILQNINDSLTINQNTIDSLLAEEGGKDYLIDSLTRKTSDLETLLKNVKSYQKIAGAGRNIPILERTEVEIKLTEQEIKDAESYNEILNKSDFQKGLSKSFVYSGETSYFTFYPPTETDGQYLDFSLKYLDDKLVDNIAVVYIEIDKKNEDGSFSQIFSSFYKPQIGRNRFKVYNLLKKKGTRMMIGFFWKDEFCVKDTPRYEKTTFMLTPE